MCTENADEFHTAQQRYNRARTELKQVKASALSHNVEIGEIVNELKHENIDGDLPTTVADYRNAKVNVCALVCSRWLQVEHELIANGMYLSTPAIARVLKAYNDIMSIRKPSRTIKNPSPADKLEASERFGAFGPLAALYQKPYQAIEDGQTNVLTDHECRACFSETLRKVVKALYRASMDLISRHATHVLRNKGFLNEIKNQLTLVKRLSVWELAYWNSLYGRPLGQMVGRQTNARSGPVTVLEVNSVKFTFLCPTRASSSSKNKWYPTVEALTAADCMPVTRPFPNFNDKNYDVSFEEWLKKKAQKINADPAHRVTYMTHDIDTTVVSEAIRKAGFTDFYVVKRTGKFSVPISKQAAFEAAASNAELPRDVQQSLTEGTHHTIHPVVKKSLIETKNMNQIQISRIFDGARITAVYAAHERWEVPESQYEEAIQLIQNIDQAPLPRAVLDKPTSTPEVVKPQQVPVSSSSSSSSSETQPARKPVPVASNSQTILAFEHRWQTDDNVNWFVCHDIHLYGVDADMTGPATKSSCKPQICKFMCDGDGRKAAAMLWTMLPKNLIENNCSVRFVITYDDDACQLGTIKLPLSKRDEPETPNQQVEIVETASNSNGDICIKPIDTRAIAKTPDQMSVHNATTLNDLLSMKYWWRPSHGEYWFVAANVHLSGIEPDMTMSPTNVVQGQRSKSLCHFTSDGDGMKTASMLWRILPKDYVVEGKWARFILTVHAEGCHLGYIPTIVERPSTSEEIHEVTEVEPASPKLTEYEAEAETESVEVEFLTEGQIAEQAAQLVDRMKEYDDEDEDAAVRRMFSVGLFRSPPVEFVERRNDTMHNALVRIAVVMGHVIAQVPQNKHYYVEVFGHEIILDSGCPVSMLPEDMLHDCIAVDWPNPIGGGTYRTTKIGFFVIDGVKHIAYVTDFPLYIFGSKVLEQLNWTIGRDIETRLGVVPVRKKYFHVSCFSWGPLIQTTAAIVAAGIFIAPPVYRGIRREMTWHQMRLGLQTVMDRPGENVRAFDQLPFYRRWLLRNAPKPVEPLFAICRKYLPSQDFSNPRAVCTGTLSGKWVQAALSHLAIEHTPLLEMCKFDIVIGVGGADEVHVPAESPFDVRGQAALPGVLRYDRIVISECNIARTVILSTYVPYSAIANIVTEHVAEWRDPGQKLKQLSHACPAHIQNHIRAVGLLLYSALREAKTYGAEQIGAWTPPSERRVGSY